MRRATATHCAHGHAFTPENTWLDGNGSRVCKTCRKQRLAEWRSRNPEKVRRVSRERMRQERLAAKRFNIRELGLQPAMDFAEIGRALGTTRKAAFQTYVRGMTKLSRNEKGIGILAELVEQRNQIRERRLYGALQVED